VSFSGGADRLLAVAAGADRGGAASAEGSGDFGEEQPATTCTSERSSGIFPLISGGRQHRRSRWGGGGYPSAAASSVSHWVRDSNDSGEEERAIRW
jgi:hypothetical protein